MIIYGIKGKVISGEPVNNFVCHHCGNDSHISFGVLRYFHIYWIPTFMFAKKAGLECVHCKKTIFNEEIPQDVRSRISSQVFNKQSILPLFSGLILISGVFLLMIIVSAIISV